MKEILAMTEGSAQQLMALIPFALAMNFTQEDFVKLTSLPVDLCLA